MLSFGSNQVASLAPLAALSSLEILDAHSNRVASVEGLQGLCSLRILNLAGE